MIRIARSLLLFAPLFFMVPAQATSKGQLTCAFVGPIQGVFFNQHINYRTSGAKSKLHLNHAEVERRTIEQYIKRLDGSKLYFYQSDVDKIRNVMSDIFAAVEKRPKPDCSRLTIVQDIFRKRVGERVAFAKKYLGNKNFKFDKSTELVLDSDEREYAKNKKAAEAFQKKYIQFQVSNFIANDMKLAEAKQRVIRRYERNLKHVEEYDQEKIFSSYLDSFARALDPHSSYFSADAMEEFRISMSLSLEGIGATLSFDDGFTTIEQLISGGAAAREGTLKPKDKIIAVGQGECLPKNEKKKSCTLENVIEMELRDVVKKIRGKKGSKVTLKILRDTGDGKERIWVTLVRDKVKLEDEAVSISYVDREVHGKKYKVGVVNLPSFYSDSKPGGRTSAGDMKRVLKEAKKNKVDSLVVDFSSNGGGSLDDAVKIAGLFFKTGAVVKQSAKTNSAIMLKDEDKAVDYSGPLVVLTSRVSASASEIVAGTLQDYKRAVVVGADHTFGKGTVQSVIPLPSGLGASKVTVGMYYIAGGNSTQHRGVKGDIILPSALSNDDVGEKTLDYSLPPTFLSPFLSKDAYVKEGKDKWQQVSESEIKKLRSLSKIRVAENKDFQEVLEDIKKNEERKHVIKIAETFKERTESTQKEKEEDKKRDKHGNRSKEAKLADYLKRAEIQEAVNVAADLVALRSGVTVTIGATQKKEGAKNSPKN